jgi:hypothetical protein
MRATTTWRAVAFFSALTTFGLAGCGSSGGSTGGDGGGDGSPSSDATRDSRAADGPPGDSGGCGSKSGYCASPADGITCTTSETQAVAKLCAGQAGNITKQSCGQYDTLRVQGVDSATAFVFYLGVLVGFDESIAPHGGSCAGNWGPGCASPSVNACPIDGGPPGAAD